MFNTFLTMARLYIVLNGLISILRLIHPRFITAVIARYPTTVASHFPSARLNYKTSTCNEQDLLDMTCVGEPKETISGTFVKYSQ